MYDSAEAFIEWAKVGTSGTSNALIEECLAAAAAQIDEHCGRTFEVVGEEAEPEAREFCTEADGRYLEVDDFVGTPTVTVGGTAVEVTVIRPRTRNRPSTTLKGLFGRYATVTVTATWGWPALPPQILQASRLIANKLWERRNSPLGIQGGAPEIGFIRVTGTDRDVDTLLAPFCRLSAGVA